MTGDTSPLTILHTAAHPGDAFDMAGGTLAHHIRRGDRVTVVVFSHGARSHALETIEGKRLHASHATVTEAAAGKEREAIQACAILGIEDVRFLQYEDHCLLTDSRHITAMARIVRQVRPQVVITHSPFEQGGLSQIHRVCCDITLQACATAAGLMDDDSLPHRVGEIFYVWQHGDTTLGDYVTPRFPAILIDVSDVADLKMRALQCVRSQYYSGRFARKVLETTTGSHGLHMCVPYCETFMRHYPEVRSLLPTCRHNLELATQPLEQTYERMSVMLTDDPTAPQMPVRANPGAGRRDRE